MLPRHGEEGKVDVPINGINPAPPGRTGTGTGKLARNRRADLLHVVAAVNGVIDLLPAVRKLCEEKQS